MASGVVLAGLVFLALGFLACGVSFCSPFWLYNHSNYQDLGLWGHGYCGMKDVDETIVGSESGSIQQANPFDTCRWRWAWEDDWAWEKDKLKEEWFIATQGLFGFGTVTLLLAFMVACGHLCCNCGKVGHSTTVAIGILVLFAVFQVAVGMVIFGIFSWLEWDASVHSSTYRYNWGFYLGIGGVFMSGFAAIFYLIESCRGRSHSGYSRGDVV